jgi:vancomycin resistance protein YoaR
MSGESYVPVTYRNQAGMNPWVVRLPLLLISGTTLFVFALIGLILLFQSQYSTRMLPGVHALNTPLGGMTRTEAEQALSAAFTYDNQAVFTFRYNDWFQQATAGELGIRFDVTATVNEAYALGHNGNLLGDLGTQMSTWLNGRSVAPVIQYDQQATIDWLARIATDFNRPPVNATLDFSGTVVVATPAQSGLTINIPATLTRLEEALRTLNTGAEIPLEIVESQPYIRDASAAAAKLNAAFSSPLTLVTDDQRGGALGPWSATVDQIRTLMVPVLIENGDGTVSYDVTANPEPLRSFLESLAPGLVTQPADGRFQFAEDTRQLTPIQNSINGRTLDVETTLQRVTETVFNTTNRFVPLAYSYSTPRYSDSMTAIELGITELVGEATTYYAGSTQARIQNIIEGLNRINGMIIAPDEEFSFNAAVGDISPEAGFVQGKVIFGGRTIDGVGGGICQVSTTLYRAVLNGGFWVSERHSHGYRVGFYEQNNQPPGLDAAIFQPTADFRFINDTPYHLLIETSIFPQDQSVQVRFYSTNPGRQVVMEGPLIRDVVPPRATIFESNGDLLAGQEIYVDWAKEGADVTLTRRILDLQGNEIRVDTIFTSYQPWAAVVQVAPTDPRLQQSQTGG